MAMLAPVGIRSPLVTVAAVVAFGMGDSSLARSPSQSEPGPGDRVAGWLLALDETDEARRLAAIEALGHSSAARAIAPLVRIARDASQSIPPRVAAIESPGRLRHPRATDALVLLLERDLVQRTGLWAFVIPALGDTVDPRCTATLVRALEDQRDAWLGRGMAARALGPLRDPAAARRPR